MRDLSILDLFILSAIDRGLNTPYRMQRESGLSLGATSPTLPKLAKRGLVRRETGLTATNRPKHEYALTDAGKQQARQGWKRHLEAEAKPPFDLDGLLRLVDMARYYGGDTASTAAIIKRAALARKHMAEACSLESAQASADERFRLRTIRAKLDALRYRAEAEGLISIAAKLSRRKQLSRSKR